jgi:hypothetical protein
VRVIRKLIFALTACLLSPLPWAATDIGALSVDLQLQKSTATQFKMAFWLAPELFLVSQQSASEAEKQQFLKMFSGYVVFMIGNAEVSALGSLSPTPRAENLKSTSLQINDNPRLSPLSEGEIKGDLKVLQEVMKPVMRNVAGALGDAMEIVIFRLPANANPKVLLAASEGSLKLSTLNEDFTWRLPLPSLLPAVYDPITGEKFPGNYRFNPFTGQKLERR